MVRRLKLLASVLVIAGVLVLTFQSGAFSQVTADRDVSASVVPDSEAYLAVDVTYGGGTVTNFCFFGNCWDLPQTVVGVENRYVEDYGTLTVQIVDGPTDVLELRNTPEQLAVGTTATVDLGCTGDVDGSGTADVTLEFDASGTNIDVDGARVTIQDVDYDCNT